jgi:hypothetical protein
MCSFVYIYFRNNSYITIRAAFPGDIDLCSTLLTICQNFPKDLGAVVTSYILEIVLTDLKDREEAWDLVARFAGDEDNEAEKIYARAIKSLPSIKMWDLIVTHWEKRLDAISDEASDKLKYVCQLMQNACKNAVESNCASAALYEKYIKFLLSSGDVKSALQQSSK